MFSYHILIWFPPEQEQNRKSITKQNVKAIFCLNRYNESLLLPSSNQFIYYLINRNHQIGNGMQ